MSNRTPDNIYEEIMELGPRSVAHKTFNLERENNQLRADFEKCVEALHWSNDFMDKLFTIGEKGGAFIGGREYVGVEKRLNDNLKALSTPSAQAIRKEK